MNHLIILTLVLNLIAGTAVFLFSLSARKRYRLPFFRTQLAYILSFNGLIVVYLVYRYALTNVLGSDSERVFDYPAISAALLALVYLAEIGMTVNLFRLVKHLEGRGLSRAHKGLFALWVILFAAASAYGLDLMLRKMDWMPFYRFHAAWMFSLILIILTVLASALVRARKRKADENSLRAFALIFLAGYAAFSVSSLDFYFFHTGLQKYYDPLALLALNLCPLLWLKFFFERAHPAAARTAENLEERLDRFCDSRGISKREREIIAQVLLGKSNKDIEKTLFISRNTVKNHLYSVFQKAGVSSRSELIHRISRFEPR